MQETTITIDNIEYTIKRLPFSEGRPLLAYLGKLAGAGVTAAQATRDSGEQEVGNAILQVITGVLNGLEDSQLQHVHKALFKHVTFKNEQGTDVPLTEKILDAHFGSDYGRYFSLIVQCLKWNYSDFLAKLPSALAT